MNIQLQNCQFFGTGLKSTREKLQRQEERDNQITFLENQKSNLKNRECDSLEDISRKLEMFHSYEDQIAAVKESYNNSQMHHLMDEAEERGEQIAKAVEKSKPKTEEERKEEQREEALGTDENKGVLSEILEEVSETADQMDEEAEEVPEELTENTAEQDFGASDTETEKLIEKNEIERMQMRFNVRV
jgi:chromosome segregation ATPase